MRFSLMSDCMKAVSYLHKTILHVHGRLTSMCCYIDSRFMLKVGDYGLTAFFELSLAEMWAAKREPDYLMAQMWKAPEHLRAEALSRYEVINSVSQKGDVYSFGIIMQELVLRSKPFSMYALSEEGIACSVIVIKVGRNVMQIVHKSRLSQRVTRIAYIFVNKMPVRKMISKKWYISSWIVSLHADVFVEIEVKGQFVAYKETWCCSGMDSSFTWRKECRCSYIQLVVRWLNQLVALTKTQ